MSFLLLFFFLPLPTEVPLLLPALGDGVAVYLALQIDINSGKKEVISHIFYIYEIILKFILSSHGFAPSLSGSFSSIHSLHLPSALSVQPLMPSLQAHPTILGKKRSHNFPYKYFTN